MPGYHILLGSSHIYSTTSINVRNIYLFQRNGSLEFDGSFNMNTGASDFSRLGNIEQWRFSNRTDYRDECGVVKGSTGELWAPEFGQPEVNVFASDICTWVIFFCLVLLAHDFGILLMCHGGETKILQHSPLCKNQWRIWTKFSAQIAYIMD